MAQGFDHLLLSEDEVAAILTDTVRDQVTDMPPVLVYMIPYAGAGAAVDAALDALCVQHPEISVMSLATMGSMMDESMSLIAASLNAMLVLAMLTAAFGVANTVMMSVEERRHEIGLLRAIGMTKQQMRRVIVGEAALPEASSGSRRGSARWRSSC